MIWQILVYVLYFVGISAAGQAGQQDQSIEITQKSCRILQMRHAGGKKASAARLWEETACENQR
jgi:hypothetical protein